MTALVLCLLAGTLPVAAVAAWIINRGAEPDSRDLSEREFEQLDK